MDYQFMDDCIHLVACRRFHKIIKNHFKTQIARHCTEECSAYQSNYDFVSRSDARYAMHRANEDGCNGYTDIMLEDYI